MLEECLIADIGITYKDNVGVRLPYLSEIRLCEIWLDKYAIKTKRYNKDFTSYGLKHYVEDECGTYVSNGALIQAGINKGFEFKKISGLYNVYFKMKINNGDYLEYHGHDTTMTEERLNAYKMKSYKAGI